METHTQHFMVTTTVRGLDAYYAYTQPTTETVLTLGELATFECHHHRHQHRHPHGCACLWRFDPCAERHVPLRRALLRRTACGASEEHHEGVP